MNEKNSSLSSFSCLCSFSRQAQGLQYTSFPAQGQVEVAERWLQPWEEGTGQNTLQDVNQGLKQTGEALLMSIRIWRPPSS